jgi:hypothetical protein
MDAVAVLSMTGWVMAELVRVFHGLSTSEAQSLVDSLAERRLALVWGGTNTKRVLDPSLALKDQSLLLIATSPSSVSVADLFSWLAYGNRGYFLRLLRSLHAQRFVELSADEANVEILPPGTNYIEALIKKRTP